MSFFLWSCGRLIAAAAAAAAAWLLKACCCIECAAGADRP